MQLEHFIVDDRQGEQCDVCGWVGYPGECHMSIDMDTGKVYCSVTCVKQDAAIFGVVYAFDPSNIELY